MIQVGGCMEEILYISDSNESIFIDVETFVKQLDQGHLIEQSVNDM